MKKNNWKQNLAAAAVVAVTAVAAAALAAEAPGQYGVLRAYASQPDSISAEDILSGNMGAGGSLMDSGGLADDDSPADIGDLTDDGGSEDIDQIIADYFQQLEDGEISAGETVASEKIENPPLVMSLEGSGRIRYTLPNGGFYTASVPNGMITDQPVDIVIPGNGVGVVQRDDEIPELPESWHFTKDGVYHVTMLFYQLPYEGTEDYNVYEVDHWFVIAGTANGRLGAIPAPEGFRITEARRDGGRLEVENPACLFMDADGTYEVFYEDMEGLGIRRETVFRRDTTAPFLMFSQETGGEALTPPVEFAPSEPGSKIYISYNGNRSYAAGTTLTAPGSYGLEIMDEAGNSRLYHLRIRQVYKLADARVIVIALLFLCAVAARLLYLRRNMKVL